MSLAVSAAVIALAAVGCPRAPEPKPAQRRFEGRGVVVTRLDRGALPAGRAVGAGAGDWLIEAPPLRAVVGALGGGPLEHSAGALLDVTREGWDDDAVEELRPAVYAGASQLRFEVVDVALFDDAGRLELRVSERSSELALELTTSIVANPARDRIDLVSRLHNAGKRTLRGLRLGDTLRWLGRTPFVPASGALTSAATVTTPWIALPGERQSYALVFPRGPMQLAYAPPLHSPLTLTPRGGEFELAPNAARRYERSLIVASGGLSSAARTAWRALGVPLGVVRGKLDPAPSWATLRALDAKGRTVLDVAADASGAFEFWLPVGSYALRLEVPGGSDDTPITVAEGAAVEPTFIVPEPARLRYRVSDAAGAALPARLVLRGIAPTKDPELGPVHSASGAGDIAYTHSGEGTLELAPGAYSVVVTHGIEWTISEHRIEVSAGRGAALRARLDHVLPTPGQVACDFHLHAEPSPDSEIALRDRVISLLAEQIEFAVATDHNHVTTYAGAVAELGAAARIATSAGVEVTTSAWGHFNVFPYPLGDPPPYSDLTPAEMFNAVRARAPDAIIQVNHPQMGDIGYFNLANRPQERPEPSAAFSAEFDTIEVFNGFDLGRLSNVESIISEWFQMIEQGRRYVAVGNSDSHTLVDQWTGYPRSYVRVGDDRPGGVTAEAVAGALRAGRVFVTNGPLIELSVAGGAVGDVVSVKQGTARAELVVRAAPWVDVRRIQLFVNGVERERRELTESGNALERYRGTTELALDRDSWVVAVVRGAVPLERVLPRTHALPFAFTNPVFVDVDGDGKFRAPPP